MAFEGKQWTGQKLYNAERRSVMGGKCSTYGGSEKRTRNFDYKPHLKRTLGETSVWMVGESRNSGQNEWPSFL
jgi:hypothetical protein